MHYFISSFPFLLAFEVGGLGFEFCVFVAGWRHALGSEWPFVIIIIITLERCAFAGVSPHEAFAYCMELVPVCLCPGPCELMSLRNLVPLRGWGEEVHSPRA